MLRAQAQRKFSDWTPPFYFLVLVYFFVGTAVRYHKGMRTFPEVLPNFRFWRHAWIACRDGVLFVATCGRRRPRRADQIALPTKPPAYGKDLGIEELPDELDDFDEEAATQPAVVVRY